MQPTLASNSDPSASASKCWDCTSAQEWTLNKHCVLLYNVPATIFQPEVLGVRTSTYKFGRPNPTPNNSQIRRHEQAGGECVGLCSVNFYTSLCAHEIFIIKKTVWLMTVPCSQSRWSNTKRERSQESKRLCGQPLVPRGTGRGSQTLVEFADFLKPGPHLNWLRILGWGSDVGY
jgi:hypothetical protein